MATIFRFLERAWRGDERLWRVWWLLGIVLGALGLLAAQALDRAPTQSTLAPFIPTLVLFALFAPYLVWCKMAWSCAKNVDWKPWSIAARVLIVIGLVQSVVALISANSK
jgi:hypothetical protein